MKIKETPLILVTVVDLLLMCLFLLFVLSKCDLCWPLWVLSTSARTQNSFVRPCIHRTESVNSSDKMIMKMMVSRENLQFNLDSKLWMGQRFIFGRPGSEEFAPAHTYMWVGIEFRTVYMRAELLAWDHQVPFILILCWILCIMSGRVCILMYIIAGVCYIHIFRWMVLIMLDIFRSL